MTSERAELKHKVSSTFKLNGFTLKSDAASYFAEALAQVAVEQRQPWIEKTLAAIEKQPLNSPIIDQPLIRDVLQACIKDVRGELDYLMIYDCFSVPRFHYSESKRKFLCDSLLGISENCIIPSNVGAKAEVFRRRYALIRQRCMRNELFRETAAVGGSQQRPHYQLKPVELLLGHGGRLDDILVLGMLTQLTEGSFFLEDPTGAVQVNLSETKFPVGMFAEGCFVLAEGYLDDQIFHCSVMGFPPAEDTATFRNHFGSVNMFGGKSSVCARANTELKAMEQQMEGGMFVFLSDVWLNQRQVMNQLARLLEGFKDSPPTAIVMMGNFSDAPWQFNSYVALGKCFTELGEMIARVPELKVTKFIFVPGPEDPCVAPILPRPPLASTIVGELQRLVPSAVFTSNPCRIQFCTQEIVIFRENTLTKLCRHGIYYPTDDCPSMPPHFVTTLAAQCHLAPLPAHVCPVYWRYDHALWLYPLPDVVVCADRCDPFTVSKLGCSFVNPSSFGKEFLFKVYMTDTHTVEDSKIDVV